MSDFLGARSVLGASRDGDRSILGNGARLMGVNWAETLLGAGYFAVMARFLGPALYGNWAYGIAAYTLVAGVAGLGFDALIILRLGRERREGGDFLGLMLTLRLALLVLGAVGLAGYALVAEPDPLTRLVLLLFIPALLGRGVALAARNCFIAYERIADYAKFIALFRGFEAGCGVAYLVAGGGLIGVAVLHGLVWVGEAGFGLWRIRSRLTRYALHLQWREATALLAQAAVLGVSATGFTWLASGPIMLLGHTAVGPAQLGQFAVVSSLAMILVSSGQAFFVAALPVFSRSAMRADGGRAYGRFTLLAIAAAGIAAAGMGWLLGPPMVEWAFGPRYAVAGAMLAPFLLIGALILMPTGYEQTLLVAGRRWSLALAYLAGGITLAGALAPAVARWGLDGALLATAAGWLVRGAVLIGVGEINAWRQRHLSLVAAITGTGDKARGRS